MSQSNNQARQVHESLKQVRVVLIAGDQPAEVLQPADRAFDFPSAAISSETAPVLSGRPLSIIAMRTDQLDTASSKTLPEGIAIGGRIVDQSLWSTTKLSFFQQRFDECHFVRTGTGDGCRERQSLAVGKDHDLGAFAAFGFADHFAPFFADEKVPSASVSLRSIRPCRSSTRSNRDHALVQIPLAVHWRNRRQQVGYDGKRSGKSFQRAPLRSTHRIPSTHARGSTVGRPRWPVRGSYGNRSAINRHCSSESSDLGSILDPAATSRDRNDIGGLLSDHQYEINKSIV